MNYAVIGLFIKKKKKKRHIPFGLQLPLYLVHPSFFTPLCFQSLLLLSATNIINGRAHGSMLLGYGFLMVIFWINYVIYVPC